MMAQKIRVGLIGFGISGQVFHAPVMRSIADLELVKITARKAEQKLIVSEKYPTALAVDHADEILNDDSIDLVVIATSNDMHYPFAKQALLAGKHVVVEKPFTNTSEQADELIALAKESGKILSVYHNLRFNSDFRTIKEVIKDERLGQIKNFEVRYDRFRNHLRPGAWREDNLPGSGIFYDLGAHLIDQTIQLFGRPNAVFADLTIQRPGAGAIDNFELLLYYPEMRVSLKGGMLAKEPTPRYTVFALNGNFLKNGVDPQEELLRAGAFPDEDPNWGKEDPAIYGKLNLLWNGEDLEETVTSKLGSYPDYYQNIADAILGKTPLIVTAEQGRDVIRIIELGIQSQAERRVISLDNELIGY